MIDSGVLEQVVGMGVPIFHDTLVGSQDSRTSSEAWHPPLIDEKGCVARIGHMSMIASPSSESIRVALVAHDFFRESAYLSMFNS